MASVTVLDPQNQGVQITPATFPELSDLVERNFINVGAMFPSVVMQMYVREPLTSRSEYKMLQEYDTDTYSRNKPAGVAVRKATSGIGYLIQIRAKRIGMEVEVTEESRTIFDKYAQVLSDLTSLAYFNQNRVELMGTHRFTFATSTSYTDMDGDTVDTTVGDGLALASTVHTLKFSSTTYSNRVSGDPLFSKGGMELARKLSTTDILDNFGRKRTMRFNSIITGDNPTTVDAVKQYLRSTSDNTQNNANVINVAQDYGWKHIILPQLPTTASGAVDSTKANWWAIAAIGQGNMGFQARVHEWEASHIIPSTSGNAQDVHKDIWYFNTRQTIQFGILSGRGYIASCPTS